MMIAINDTTGDDHDNNDDNNDDDDDYCIWCVIPCNHITNWPRFYNLNCKNLYDFHREYK